MATEPVLEPVPCAMCGDPADVVTDTCMRAVSPNGADFLMHEFGELETSGLVYTCATCTRKMGNVWQNMAERTESKRESN